MAQFVSFHPDAEIIGQSVYSFLQAAEFQSAVIGRILSKTGFPQRVVPTDWYSNQRWLDALRLMSESIGENTLLSVGKRIVESAVWPDDVETIDAGLASVDVAYHMNHRIAGERLFDPETGVLKDGIGNYHYRPEGKRRGVMTCHNPYPSEFDRGIILAIARKFKPAAEVALDEGQPSRKRGDASCTYVVTW